MGMGFLGFLGESFDSGTVETVTDPLAQAGQTFATDPSNVPASNQQLGSAKIRQIQSALTADGFDTQGIDGIWGPHTQGAFILFQQSAGILVDGIYGPQSDAALLGGAAQPPPQPIDPGQPAPPPPPLGDAPPEAGMSTTTMVAIAAGALLLGGVIYASTKKKKAA